MDATYSDVGTRNLRVLDGAVRFQSWMLGQALPYLRGDVIEIGSGIGTYTARAGAHLPEHTITATDIDPVLCGELKERFGESKNISVDQLDITNTSIHEQYGSAFSFNVFEHIKDDERAFRNTHALLKPGGVFVVLVPAHPKLYNRIDEAVGHYRRYTKQELVTKATQAGFVIEDAHYFNVFAIPGWIFQGKFLGKGTVSEGSMRAYDMLVPMFRFIETRIFRRRIGISLVAVLRKQ